MNYNAIEVGKRIKESRINHSYSQIVFAELIGVSREHLGSIERGVKNPSIDLLIVISETCSISLDYLVLGRMEATDIHLKLRTVAAELMEIARQLE